MEYYQIPSLYCPFETVAAPELEKKIEQQTNMFLSKFDLVSEERFEFYRAQRFASMIVRSYPLGGEEILCAWCDLNTLLFLVDDDLDERFDIADEVTLSAFTDKFIEILETGICRYDEPVYRAFHDFWMRIISLSSERWQRIFIQNVKDMWTGGLWQFRHIISGRKPSLDEYYELRQYLGAAHLATDSLEITANIPLLDEVFGDEKVQALTQMCRNAICFANDLFSLGKEMAHSHLGAEFNLITILARERNLSIKAAIHEAVTIHDQSVKNFIKMSEQIYRFDEKTNRLLEKYIVAMGYLMKGNIDWSTKDTSRYPHIYLAV